MTETTDQAELHERIAVLLAETDGWEYAKGLGLRDMSESMQQHYDKLATAVLSVLPAPPEEQRLALSQALGLGTGAPWDAIRDRAAELPRAQAEAYQYRTALQGTARAATVPASAPADFELRGTGEIRAAAFTEAADFLRDAHFDEGLSVQEIGTALRHWADRERADAASAASSRSLEPAGPEFKEDAGTLKSSGPGRVAGETQQDETQALDIEPLARLLSAADVALHDGHYPSWDQLAESGEEQYLNMARWLLRRLRITDRKPAEEA